MKPPLGRANMDSCGADEALRLLRGAACSSREAESEASLALTQWYTTKPKPAHDATHAPTTVVEPWRIPSSAHGARGTSCCSLLARREAVQTESFSLTVMPCCLPPSASPRAAARGEEEDRRFRLVARREGAEALRARLHHQSAARVKTTPDADAASPCDPPKIAGGGALAGGPALRGLAIQRRQAAAS